jgi:phytoene synthase
MTAPKFSTDDRAGVEGMDAAVCADIVRTHARTFTLAAGLLPRDKRRGAFALYAFCRIADDFVDGVGGQEPGGAALRLAAHRRSMEAALAGAPAGPVFRELAWAVRRFGVPAATLHELCDGVARDLTPTRYTTWADLESYCSRVASSVGEMCTHVFGVVGGGGRETLACAVRRGRTLGLAMQLTNILRDVGEDARRGRCYLPESELMADDLSTTEVLNNPGIAADERWHAFMRRQIERARELYATAEPGIALLSPDARQCAATCARGYALILDSIEDQGYDTIRTRAVVPSWRKASLLLAAWRYSTA